MCGQAHLREQSSHTQEWIVPLLLFSQNYVGSESQVVHMDGWYSDRCLGKKKLFWLNKSTWYSMFCVSLEKCPLHYLLLNQQTAVLIFLNCRSPLKQRWNTVEMYFSGKLGNPKSTLNSDISSRCNINLVAPYLKGVGGEDLKTIQQGFQVLSDCGR